MVSKAAPKASQSMVLPKAKIARQIGCGSLELSVFFLKVDAIYSGPKIGGYKHYSRAVNWLY